MGDGVLAPIARESVRCKGTQSLTAAFTFTVRNKDLLDFPTIMVILLQFASLQLPLIQDHREIYYFGPEQPFPALVCFLISQLFSTFYCRQEASGSLVKQTVS